MTIKVDDVKFLSLFSSDSIYFIPTYQRSYSWGEEEIKDFWEDIVNAYENDQPQYVMGTIYLAKVLDQNMLSEQIDDQILSSLFNITEQNQNIECDDENASIKLIVDGQQRLITYFLLNKAFDSSGVSKSVFNRFFCNTGSGKSLPRIILGHNDYQFFIDYICNKKPIPSTQSNKRIQKAYDELLKQIENYIPSNHSRSLNDLYDYSKNKLIVLEAKIDDIDMANTIFITQSDRGKELTYLEKLKGILSFYSSKIGNVSLSKKIDKVFGECFNVIDLLTDLNIIKKANDAENEFINLVRYLVYVVDEPSRVAFDNIKIDLRATDNINLPSKIETIVEALNDIAKFYVFIANNLSVTLPDCHSGKTWLPYNQVFKILKPSLKSISMLIEFYKRNLSLINPDYSWSRHTPCDQAINNIPILRDKYSSLSNEVNKIADFNIKHFLSDKLKNICNTLTHINTNPDISLINLIESFELSIWKILDPRETFARLYSTYIQNSTINDGQTMINPFNYLIESYRNGYMLENRNYGLFSYILLEYERCIYGDDLSSAFLNKSLSLEHVFPQTDDSNKIGLTEYGFSGSGDYSRWIWRIGNIMLLDVKDNSAAGDNPIVGKIPVYKKSSFKSVKNVKRDLELLSASTKHAPNHYFKLYLEIRELEITYFTYCRFI